MSSFQRTASLVVLAVLAVAPNGRAQEIYVSASFDADASGATEVSGQLLGSRFTVVAPVDITHIGGNLRKKVGVPDATLFGAIVELIDGDSDGTIDDVPQGIKNHPSSPNEPFNATELAAASTTFTLVNETNLDVRFPLAVTLQPGNYALIFGAGHFGSPTGEEGIIPNFFQDDTETPVAPALISSAGLGSYFFWNPNSSGGTWFNTATEGLRFVVEGRPANDVPIADATIQQLTDIGPAAAISLDASGSSDDDHAVSQLIFRWTIDGDEICEGDLAICAVVQTFVAFGEHEITLTVTDPLGASDQATTIITIDPAALSLLDFSSASVNFAEAPQLTVIDIVGGIGLPPDVDYSELQPTAAVRLTLAGIEALPATVVDFTTAGTGGQQWGFDGSTATAGISRFDIDWRGARYRFSEPGFPVRLTSDMITIDETVLDVMLRPNQIDFPFTMEIDGLVTINFEAAGIVSSESLPAEAIIFVRPGRLTLELPFRITQSSVITFHGSLENTVNVGDDLKNSVGRFHLRVLADSTLFPDGAVTTPRTIDLDVTIGQQAYAGSVALDETDLSVSGTSWVTD